jgi:hypothetical protein
MAAKPGSVNCVGRCFVGRDNDGCLDSRHQHPLRSNNGSSCGVVMPIAAALLQDRFSCSCAGDRDGVSIYIVLKARNRAAATANFVPQGHF